MWRFLKSLLVFRVGQKSSRGVAKVLGLGRFGLLIGLVGGWRAIKKHRHA
jgi:hypothetical protein